jgi:hypothetical protein
MCPVHRRLFVRPTPPPPAPDSGPAARAEPATEPPAEPAAEAAAQVHSQPPDVERLALKMPWGQQINLPDDGALDLGRSSPQFRDHPTARDMGQISREHARFSRDPLGTLLVEDRGSTNGTFVDGVRVTGGPHPLRAGQTLRLAQDVDCLVIRLNEHGEPV